MKGSYGELLTVKKRRTVDEAFCSINNGDRGINCNGAVDARLYIRGNGTGTEATNCGAGLPVGKHRINRIFNL